MTGTGLCLWENGYGITCPQCGGRAMPLLRNDDVIENVCESCGLVTTTPVPHRPLKRQAESDKDYRAGDLSVLMRDSVLCVIKSSNPRSRPGSDCTRSFSNNSGAASQVLTNTSRQ